MTHNYSKDKKSLLLNNRRYVLIADGIYCYTLYKAQPFKPSVLFVEVNKSIDSLLELVSVHVIKAFS